MSEIQSSVFKIHPVYNLYAANKNGEIIHIIKKNLSRELIITPVIYLLMLEKYGDQHQKRMLAHRFIWECFYVIIPEGKVIDHINDKRDDNRLCNLQSMTPSENTKNISLIEIIQIHISDSKYKELLRLSISEQNRNHFLIQRMQFNNISG